MKKKLIGLIKHIYQFIFYPIVLSNSRGYKKGLSALVCCKDEEHNIPLCLESVSKFASQIICVDNGSTDNTLGLMKEFKDKYGKQIDIEVIEAPNAPLKDARNMGLAQVKHKWLLNSGGDFVFYTSGPNSFKAFFESVSASPWSQGWRFGFINLYGDLHHTYKRLKIYSLGEHYLVKMNRKLKFHEEGKFDYLKLPWYCLSYTNNKPLFFHLDGLKSDERLIYRNAYFEWRMILNNAEGSDSAKLADFDRFYTLWKEELFGSSEPKKLKFRFQRQLASIYYQPYDVETHQPYPAVIERLIASGNERFKVIYNDGQPYLRNDTEDPEMNGFTPEKNDLEWDIQEYDKMYYAKDYLRIIKQKIVSND